MLMSVAPSVKTKMLLEKYSLENLSNEEKHELAEALDLSVLMSENFDVDTDDVIPPWHLDIIRERIEDTEKNPDDYITLDELRKKWADSGT